MVFTLLMAEILNNTFPVPFFTASSVKILSVTLKPEMKKGKRSISDNDRQPCNSGLSELNE